jgi:hypothetical protein
LPLRAPVGRSVAIREERLPRLAASNIDRGLAGGFCAIRRINQGLGNLCDRGPGLPCGRRCNHQLGEWPLFAVGSCLGDQPPAPKGENHRRRPLWRFFADALPLVVSNGGWTVRSSPPTICYRSRTSFHQYPSAGSDLADPHPDLTDGCLSNREILLPLSCNLPIWP